MGMRRLGLVLLVMMVIIYSMSGCGNPRSKPLPDQSQSGEQREPAPRELQQLQTSLEKLYKELKPEPVGAMAAKQKQEKATGGKSGRSEEQGGAGGEEQRRSPVETRTPGKIDWGKLHAQVERIHLQWSRLEHRVIQAGARPEDVAGMEQELNILPARISAQDRSGVRLAANDAAGYLPDFLELYATRTPPDLLRLRYLARDVANRVDDGDWTGADQDIVKMRDTWSRALLQAKGAPRSETGKVHFAMGDLEEAVNNRDRDLVLIKEGILEENLDVLRKRLEAKM